MKIIVIILFVRQSQDDDHLFKASPLHNSIGLLDRHSIVEGDQGTWEGKLSPPSTHPPHLEFSVSSLFRLTESRAPFSTSGSVQG